MKEKIRFRIWISSKIDGEIYENPIDLSFASGYEADKCVAYLNAKRKNETYSYYSKKETVKEFKNFEEYINELELKQELER